MNCKSGNPLIYHNYNNYDIPTIRNINGNIKFYIFLTISVGTYILWIYAWSFRGTGSNGNFTDRKLDSNILLLILHTIL